jgi:hypothetical protein
MNYLPALQNQNDGLDTNSVRKNAGTRGGAPAAWQGPDLEKIPAHQNFQNSRIEGAGK